MESTGRLPDDPALPALEAIRIKGLAHAIPELELDNDPVELRLCNYVAGSRATFEARVGDRRFAVKAYAEDPAPEAQLYRRLSQVGLAGDFGARVPKLIATSRELKVLVMSWLEGRPLSHLIRRGLGERAGQLGASWLWHVSRRRIRIGPPCGPGRMLYQAGVSAGVLGRPTDSSVPMQRKPPRSWFGCNPRRSPVSWSTGPSTRATSSTWATAQV